MTDTTQEAVGAATETAPGAGQTNNPADASGKGKAAAAAAAAATLEQGRQAAEGAGDDKPWYDGLPDDLKKEKSLLRFASLEDATRAFVGAEKRLGIPHDQVLRMPSTPEETKALYAKLGAPETADGYQIEVPADASDDDKAAAKSFAEHMHKAGPFPADFVKAAVEWNNAQAEAASTALADAQAARRAESEALLKKELGAAYDPDFKAVGKLLAEIGGQDLADELDASGLGDNPRLMLALHKLMDERAEPGALEGQREGKVDGAKLSIGQAKAALENLIADPVKGAALRDNTHSMHQSVLKERNRLAAMADGIDPDA